MQASNNQINNENSHEARPSLGKALTADQAARRFELRGFWACERKDRIRVVEFKDDGNGSASVTHWFDDWFSALKQFGITAETNDVCAICGTHHDDALNKYMNRAGNWICMACESEMTETMNDLFYLSQGRWKV